ncbi:hypothetical protein ABE414_03075 [Luteimonas sp. TWI1415]|uniref:hypothetical protein n=1 Tax=unclassified Luteimonas TaxID=2629088 RepID=UPI00320A9B5E
MVDERGGDGFDLIADKHHYIRTQFLDAHGSCPVGSPRMVAMLRARDKRVVLSFASEKLTRYDACRLERSHLL